MMSEKQLDLWAKTRTLGFRRFLWIRGALGWGVPVALMTTGVISATSTPSMSGWAILTMLILALIIGTLVGLAWGWLVWRSSEKEFLEKYGNYQSDNKQLEATNFIDRYFGWVLLLSCIIGILVVHITK